MLYVYLYNLGIMCRQIGWYEYLLIEIGIKKNKLDYVVLNYY